MNRSLGEKIIGWTGIFLVLVAALAGTYLVILGCVVVTEHAFNPIAECRETKE